MSDFEYWDTLLAGRCFTEAAYFCTISARSNPSARAHMSAGLSCCGCAHALAIAQRILEDDPVPENERHVGSIHVSPQTELLYEGFFHLLEAVRLDPAIKAPAHLRDVFDSVADNLVFISRCNFHRPPDRRKRHSLRDASLAAAVLLRRLTDSKHKLKAPAPSLDYAEEIIEVELARSDGDAMFY